MFIIGEIFSLLAAICLCASTFCKKKRKMVTWQVMDSILNALANLFLLSYSGFITNIFTAIRNILEAKKIKSKFITIIFCIILIILGFKFNNRGVIGLLPIFASIEYTIFMFKSKTSQALRIGLIINLIPWSIYDMYIRSYPIFITDLIIISFSIFNINKYKKQNLN